MPSSRTRLVFGPRLRSFLAASAAFPRRRLPPPVMPCGEHGCQAAAHKIKVRLSSSDSLLLALHHLSDNATPSFPPSTLSTPPRFPPPLSTPPCAPPPSFTPRPPQSLQETSLIDAIICIIFSGDARTLSAVVVAARWPSTGGYAVGVVKPWL